ncbi:T9SS type A sorting domain-containing protein [Flavobacterium myungsuense]
MTSNATPCLTSSPATSNTVTMTVNPNLPASVSIEASATTICPGTSVTFTATPTNGGTSPSYQWKLNGTNIGADSATFTTTTLVNGDSVTVTMTSNATPCLTNSPVSSNTITISTGGSTTWNGTSWSNGAPTSSSAAIISGNYSIAANINACSLTVDNNAIVIIPSGYNVNLNNAITVVNGSSFTLSNNANLLQRGTTNSNSGAIVVNRNSSLLMRLDYTLWSSPVANQNVLSFSPNTMTNRFYQYVSSTNFYEPIVPSTSVFSAAKGFLIRVSNTHPTTPTIWTGKFTGVPNNGDYNYNLFYNQVTNVDPNLTKTYGFNLVGNPYPSPISMTEFVNDNRDFITGALYFWRETNGDLVNNSYCIWAGGTFISNVEANVSTPKPDPNGIIQTGQGFIVEANKSSAVLQFKNSQRIANNANQFFRTSQNEERNTVWLNVTSTKGAFSQTAISYVTGATQGVDVYDAKVFGTGAVELSSIVEQANYAIQGRALPFDENDTVPLGFKAKTAGEYTIAIDRSIGLFADAQDIFLKDNMTKVVHNLKLSPYTFTAEIGSFNDRFIVVYKNETTLAVAVNNFDLEDTISIMFTNNDNTISVKNSSPNTIVESVMLYNLLGQSISTWDVSNENQSALIKVLVRDLSTGTYVVRLKTSEGIIAKKIIIKNVKVTSKTKEKKDIYIQKSMLADED